jgi:hypothetical protein
MRKKLSLCQEEGTHCGAGLMGLHFPNGESLKRTYVNPGLQQMRQPLPLPVQRSTHCGATGSTRKSSSAPPDPSLQEAMSALQVVSGNGRGMLIESLSLLVAAKVARKGWAASAASSTRARPC